MRHFALLDPKKRFSPKSLKLHSKMSTLFSVKAQIGKIGNLWKYLKKNKYLTFSFVRHPFDRLVSAYKDKAEGGQFLKHTLIKHYGNFAFSTFLKHILKGKRNTHWQLFHTKCSYCGFSYSMIGRAETFDQGYIFRKCELGVRTFLTLSLIVL